MTDLNTQLPRKKTDILSGNKDYQHPPSSRGFDTNLVLIVLILKAFNW